MKIHRKVFSPIEVNTYVIADDTGDAAIIDCGCYDEAEFDQFRRFLKTEGINPVLLLNTHMHLDHIFGNRFMLRDFGLETHTTKNEESNRLSAVDHAMLYGLDMEPAPVPGTFLADGDKISFGNSSFEVIYVPGHTAGSVAFYDSISASLFTGDALFNGSIGRTDLPGGDYDTLIGNIRNRLLVLPGETKVFPGHGPQSTIAFEKANNPFLV